MLIAGARVRLRAPNPLADLAADTGTVVRKDDWADYYIVRLDARAQLVRPDGSVEPLWEIREDADNLEIID